MIYNKLQGTTSTEFQIGKNGVSIANEAGLLKVIVPIINSNDSYQFLIGVDEITPGSKNIPSGEAIIQFIEEEIGTILEGSYLDLSTENIQYVAGPVVFENDVTVEGTLKGPENFIIDAVVEGDTTGKLGTVTIHGNLQVDGTTTTLNSTIVEIKDKNITLASGSTNSGAADGAGITIDGADATITYVATGDKFEINKDLDVDGTVSGTQLISTVPNPVEPAPEQAPIFVYSRVRVENLNADMLDGKHLSDIEAERVPRSLGSLSAMTFNNALAPDTDENPIFIYADDGSSTGKKISIKDIIRPSVFKIDDEETIDHKVKIGDFVYTEL
jgi:hypothetical protein